MGFQVTIHPPDCRTEPGILLVSWTPPKASLQLADGPASDIKRLLPGNKILLTIAFMLTQFDTAPMEYIYNTFEDPCSDSG